MAKLPVPINAEDRDSRECVQPVQLSEPKSYDTIVDITQPRAHVGMFWSDPVQPASSYNHHGVVMEFATFADAYADYIERCKRRNDDIDNEMQEVRDLILARNVAVAEFCEAISIKRAAVKALRSKRPPPAPKADDYER